MFKSDFYSSIIWHKLDASGEVGLFQPNLFPRILGSNLALRGVGKQGHNNINKNIPTS